MAAAAEGNEGQASRAIPRAPEAILDRFTSDL
jgi:hypothetical protein